MRRGELFRVYQGAKYDPKNFRVFLVVSRQALIDTQFSTVICAPVYSKYKEAIPTQVEVGADEGLKHDSAIYCDDLASIPKSILTNYIGSLSADPPSLSSFFSLLFSFSLLSLSHFSLLTSHFSLLTSHFSLLSPPTSVPLISDLSLARRMGWRMLTVVEKPLTFKFPLLLDFRFFSCYIYSMTITQTVEIPENRRLIIDVPREVPAGRTIIIFKPINELTVSETTASADEALNSANKILEKHLPAFKELAK
ncbi:hypothetical protein R84B8_01966 [Treponema sp. R8-4-B8]